MDRLSWSLLATGASLAQQRNKDITLDLLDLSEEELTLRVSQHLEVLALKTRAKGYIWILVTNDDQKVGDCSPNLKAYEWTMGELVARAAEV
jgi:hypothetical protein